MTASGFSAHEVVISQMAVVSGGGCRHLIGRRGVAAAALEKGCSWHAWEMEGTC